MPDPHVNLDKVAKALDIRRSLIRRKLKQGGCRIARVARGHESVRADDLRAWLYRIEDSAARDEAMRDVLRAAGS